LSFGFYIGNFHSYFQYFISHKTSSGVMQYIICNHSLSRFNLSWIHILCRNALKFPIILCSSTTFDGILHVSSTFSYIICLENAGIFLSFSFDGCIP
jgi:hypothetical protein